MQIPIKMGAEVNIKAHIYFLLLKDIQAINEKIINHIGYDQTPKTKMCAQIEFSDSGASKAMADSAAIPSHGASEII
jgi:hypothetical protein